MKDKKHKFFQDLAGEWDRFFYKDNNNAKDLDALVKRFQIKKGLRVADIGCGTGVISQRISKLGVNQKIIACDWSLNMLKEAQKKTRNKNIAFLCADAHNLPLQGSGCDRVILFSCFPHFDNKQRVLKEVNRILRRKGRCFICHLLSSKEIVYIHRRAGKAVAQDRMLAPKLMRALLKNSGFKILNYLDKKGLYFLEAEKT